METCLGHQLGSLIGGMTEAGPQRSATQLSTPYSVMRQLAGE